MRAAGRSLLVAGLLTGTLVGTSVAMALGPGGDGNRERLRTLAREAREREASGAPRDGHR